MDEKNLLKKQDWEAFALVQLIEDKDEKRILLKGNPYMSWKINDQIAQPVAIVELYKSGLANQEALAKIFNLHINSIYNYITNFESKGMKGLLNEKSGPVVSWKITPETRSKILFTVLRERVVKYKEIQKRLEDRWRIKVSIESIRQVLKENGFIKESIDFIEFKQEEFFETDNQLQLEINFLENKNNEEKISIESQEQLKENNIAIDLREISSERKNISSYSSGQRIYLNQLEQGEYSAYAGGLLFMPLLVRYNFLPMLERVISIKEYEGYTLEQLCLCLFYFDIFGFESIENFKTVYSDEYGVLIGKTNSPSIYTLRRFLHKIRELKKGEELIEECGSRIFEK